MADSRTKALFTVWSKSRQLVLDDDGIPLVKYYDGACITIPRFIVHVGNQEFETNDLEEAERWLWNNWVAGEKECEQV